MQHEMYQVTLSCYKSAFGIVGGTSKLNSCGRISTSIFFFKFIYLFAQPQLADDTFPKKEGGGFPLVNQSLCFLK